MAYVGNGGDVEVISGDTKANHEAREGLWQGRVGVFLSLRGRK